MSEQAQAVERFVLQQTGGVLHSVSIERVCQLLLTWNDALALEADWPADHAMPVGSLDDLSIEDKIDRLREKGLYDIMFRNGGVGLMFFEPPEGVAIDTFTTVERDIGDGQMVQMPISDNSWKKYLTVETYYDSFQEAVEAEFNGRCGV